MKKLLIGTNNPSKLQLIRSWLEDLAVQCVSPAELGLQNIPDENARTAKDNAIEKARAWHRMTELPVVTEDSGLVFLDLPAEHPDQPGVMVRRAAGHTMDDDEMLTWYQAIIRRHGGQLRASWEDAWCVLQDKNTYHTHCDTPEKLERHARILLDKPCKTRLPGWPLDSLTYFPAVNKYKAEMSIEEMSAISEVLNQDDKAELIGWLQKTIESII